MTKTAIKNTTKNDLAESAREAMIELLQQSTAEAVDLQTQAKLAHWNVKGENFIALHKLFDDATDEIRNFSDELAERLVQLGGLVEGNVQTIAKTTNLPTYSTEIQAGKDHVDAFSSALATFGAHVRANIDKADQAGDMDTADLFTEVSRGIDKLLWFVEAHNQ